MKIISTPRFSLILWISILSFTAIHAQFVGIGTSAPDYKLHVAGNTAAILKLENISSLATGIPTEMYFKTGSYYTGGIKTIGHGTAAARMGFFTWAATNQSQLLERMSIMDNGFIGIGNNSPQYIMDINGRIRVRHGNGTAGMLVMDAANVNTRGFFGMKDDNNLGLFGYGGGGWALTMNVISGTVSMDAELYVNHGGSQSAHFVNNSGEDDYTALLAEADVDPGSGTGVIGRGGFIGVSGNASEPGGGSREGVYATGRNGDNNNFGVYTTAYAGANTYGVYAIAQQGYNSNWGGYFTGSLYTTGNYQGSDRKLKTDIQPMQHATQLIKALKPSTYTYRTAEYTGMQLPNGQQFGLIADEVKQVFPDLVKKAVQPAMYENDDPRTGRIIADEVTFEAVNYTALIPVLIAAMQEQQAMIDAQQQQIEELEKRIYKE